MKKLLTVKEYADLQNTSVQNIYKKIKRDKIAVIEKKDDTGRVIKYIEFDDNTEEETNIEDTLNEDNLNSSIDSSEDNKEKQSNKNTTELELLKKTIEIIEGQLKEKDKQIESLNSQIEKLSTMLDQSQKLQALSLTKKAEITEGVVDEEVEEKEPIENNNSEKSLQNEEKSIWQRIKDWFTL